MADTGEKGDTLSKGGLIMATGQIKTNKTTYIVDGDTFEPIDEGARAGIASLKEDLTYSKEDLTHSNGAIEIEYEPGYIDLSVGTGNLVTLTPSPMSGRRCAVYPCSEGDVFTITGHGGNAPRVYGFVDSNDKLLSLVAPASSEYTNGIVIVAPQNAAKIILNDRTSPAGRSFAGQYGTRKQVSDRSVGNESFLYDLVGSKNVFNPNDVKSGKFVNTANGEIYVGGVAKLSNYIPIPKGKQYISATYVSSDRTEAAMTGGYLWFYDEYYHYIKGYENQTIEGITIPENAFFVLFGIVSGYLARINYIMLSFTQTHQKFRAYIPLEEKINDIEGDDDLSGTAVSARWFTGTTIGGSLTIVSGGDRSSKLSVSEGEMYKISCSGGGSGRAYYLLDSSEKIVELADASVTLEDYYVVIPSGVSYLVVQTASSSYWGLEKIYGITRLEKDAQDMQSVLNITPIPNKVTCNTKYGTSALAKLKVTDSGVVNIGFIGDSWTQGTPDNIEQNKYETYVKWLSKKLWEEYGFAGLGWLDFGRDSGNSTIFGCSDLYEHWGATFSGNVTGVDGSNGDTASASCLGICCAHTVFNEGAKITLTFVSGYLDKFNIAYYKNAHFTVSINDGEATEITANSSDGWQITEIGTTGTDTRKVVITSLADDSIIFGMDCFYGSKGVRCHKIGNRGMTIAHYLMMNESQFVNGVASLGLSWVSLLFAINDIGISTDDSACQAIITRYNTFINRVKTACTRDGLMSCDISLLGCANISNSGYTGLPLLEEYEHKFALKNGYGWVSTRECIGATKEELVETGLFSDGIHLNKVGAKLFGDYVYRWLIESIGINVN